MSTVDDRPSRLPVLLIEDETGLAEEISAELRRLGYPVQHADNVEDGLRAARNGGVAIMVVDRMLHGSDGLSMVEALREEGVKTPVLVISALSSVDERIRGLKA